MGMKALDELELPPLTVENVDDEGLDLLKEAIVESGCRDYIAAYRIFRRASGNTEAQNAARIELDSETRFFHSEWYRKLTNEQIDGDSVMRKLRTDPPMKWLNPDEKAAINEFVENEIEKAEKLGIDIDEETILRGVKNGDFIGKEPSEEYRKKVKAKRKAEHDRIKARYKAREQENG